MYWYVLAHAVIPIPLLLFAWYRRLSYAPPSPRKGFLLLLLAPTASDAWFFLATKYPNAIGDSYSNLRYVVIELNLLAMLACAVLALLSNTQGRLPLAIASVLLAAFWLFVLVANVAV